MIPESEDRIMRIDWNIHALLGYENNHILEQVLAIMPGIADGDSIPPVPVHESLERENTYYISPYKPLPGLNTSSGHSMKDAGHHRAIAHYLMGTPLACEVLPGKAWYASTILAKDIRDMTIRSDPKEYIVNTARFRQYKDYNGMKESFRQIGLWARRESGVLVRECAAEILSGRMQDNQNP